MGSSAPQYQEIEYGHLSIADSKNSYTQVVIPQDMPWVPGPAGGGWHTEPPDPLGVRLKPGSSPSATTWGRDNVRVYFFDDQDHLCFKEGYPHRGWGGLQDTNIIVYQPNQPGTVVSPAAVNTVNGVRIFFRGQNNGLWWITSGDGTNFQGPTEILDSQNRPSILTSDPSAASRSSSLDVFYSGSTLDPPLVWRQLTFHQGWGDEYPFWGITVKSSPAAVSWGGNRMDVFYRGGGKGALGVRTDDGNGWGGGDDLGDSLASAPAVASWAPGRFDVFFRGLNGHVWHKFNGPGWPSDDRDYGLTMDANTSPTAASIGPGKLAAFFSSFYIDHSDIQPIYYYE